MQEIVPPLAPHYGRLPEVLPAEGKRRARVALFTRLRRRRLLPADEPGHGPRAAAQRLRGVDAARPGLLRRPALPRRPGRAGAEVRRRQLRGVRQGTARRPRQVDAIINNAGGCGPVLKEYGHLLENTPAAAAGAAFAAKVQRHQRVPGRAGPGQADASAADQGDLPRRLRPEPRPEDPPAAAAAAGPDPRPGTGAAGRERASAAARPAATTSRSRRCRTQLGQRKAKNILATGAQAVFTGNVGCSAADRPPSARGEAGHVGGAPGRCAVGELQREAA